MSWGKKVPIGASTDTSFTSNFDLFDAVLQLLEAVNMKRVDMSTSSAIGEVAGIFQGRNTSRWTSQIASSCVSGIVVVSLDAFG